MSARFELVSAETVLEGKIFRVRRGRFRYEDGSEAEREWVEHVVLRRIDGDWRILSVAVASTPRGSAR